MEGEVLIIGLGNVLMGDDAFGPTVGLGATVLRAETAAVTAGALLCALRNGVVLPLA